MTRLKSRQLQIPNGFRFLQPETGWSPRRGSSFQGIVEALILHRRGNQALMAKGLSINPRQVADEVEQYNVRLCETMGWHNYIETGVNVPLPKSLALSQQSQHNLAAAAGHIKKIWSGVRTINEWLDSGEAGVAQAQAEHRAFVCAACPRNEKGDFSRWFTIPASEAIRRQLEKAEGRQLKTTLDDKLNVCGVCLCPLKLSVHVPLPVKLAHLSREVEAELRQVTPRCWVISEKDGN